MAGSLKQLTIFILLYFTALISVTGCKKSNPLTPEDPTPGRRDYTWRIDTLFMPMNLGESIWASSAQDVWVLGAGGFAGEGLQHFDGEKWEGINEPINGNILFGFSKDNLWLGSNEGQILHYNGSRWSRSFEFEVAGSKIVDINNIWGSSPNDIYACGYIFYKSSIYEPESVKGFILHYDGKNWKEVCRGEFNSVFLSARKGEGKVFVWSYNLINGEESDVYYELKDGKLKELFSNSTSKSIMGNNFINNGAVYFSIGNAVFRYKDDLFIKLFSVDYPNYGYGCYIRSERDIILRMQDGLAHYNGTDIQYIYHFPSPTMSTTNEPVILEKDVFFLLWDQGRTLVLHGKLKEQGE